jgi:hypothetical protein
LLGLHFSPKISISADLIGELSQNFNDARTTGGVSYPNRFDEQITRR